VERTVPTPFSDSDSLVFNLNRADFTTATRMAESINKLLGTNTARAIDSTSVRVNSPSDLGQKVSFASVVENLNVDMDEAPARVIVNSRTGTVIISSKVRVSPAAVSHGSLVVTIDENINVSQPNALSNGQTAATPNSNVSAKEEKNQGLRKGFFKATAIRESAHSLRFFPSCRHLLLQPNPLACRRAARPEYRPCCLKATAARTKTIPRGTG
jgi:flagellar basal body P-ring protein FlgI